MNYIKVRLKHTDVKKKKLKTFYEGINIKLLYKSHEVLKKIQTNKTKTL